MPETLLDLESAAWTGLLAQSGVADPGGTIVVCGEGADAVAHALLHTGGPPPTVTVGDIVICSRSAMPEPVPGDPIVAPASVDTVIAIRRWPDRAQLAPVVAELRSWCKPNGTVVLAELDALRLVTAQPSRYPAAALYRTRPDIARVVRAGAVSSAELGLAAIRARIRRPAVVEFERPVATFDDPSAFRSGIEFGVLRGVDRLGDGLADTLQALRLERYVPRYPVVIVEPWVALVGTASS